MTLRNSLTSVELFQNSCLDCSTYYYYLSKFFSHQTQHVEKGQTIIHKCCCVQLLSSRCSKPLSRKHHGKNFRLSLFFCLKITSSHHLTQLCHFSTFEGFQLVSMLSFFPQLHIIWGGLIFRQFFHLLEIIMYPITTILLM